MASTLLREYPQKKWHKQLVEKNKEKDGKNGITPDHCYSSKAEIATAVCICRSVVIGY